METLPLTDEVIANLKAENTGTDLHLLEESEEGITIVVKVPSDGEWKRFQSMASDDGQRPLALRTLLQASVVYPEREALGSLLTQRPGLAQSFGARLVQLAGANREVRAKKL